MSAPITSLVPVPIETAVKAAHNMLIWVERRRAKVREKTILSVLKHRKVKTGWFKSRAITRAEAEDIVDNAKNEFGHHYFYEHRINHGGNETLAENIIGSAAICSGGVIYLNIEDASITETFVTLSDEEGKEEP